MSGLNCLFLLLISGVTGKLKDLARHVFKDGSHKNSSAHANLIGVASLLNVSVHSSAWEHEVALL